MEKKYYCKICGSLMTKTIDVLNNWTKYHLDTYNELTGQKIDYSGIKYSCPKGRWFNLHDTFFIRNNQ